jgi:hypothetical protein
MQKVIPLLVAVMFHTSSLSQSVSGFWEVKEVMVGTDIKTPVAKWTRVNDDGSYQAGNGWIQNSEGTWSYDKSSQTYLPVEANGFDDHYGAFKVSFKDTQMIWEREEDGLHVTVKLERITKLPKSTADNFIGLWNLKEPLKKGASEKSLVNQNNKQYIFMRWDRMYVERTPNGDKRMGFWHMNAHRPEVTLISNLQDKKSESWTVLVNDSELRMTGISDSNKGVVMIYTRIHEFPN